MKKTILTKKVFAVLLALILVMGSLQGALITVSAAEVFTEQEWIEASDPDGLAAENAEEEAAAEGGFTEDRTEEGAPAASGEISSEELVFSQVPYDGEESFEDVQLGESVYSSALEEAEEVWTDTDVPGDRESISDDNDSGVFYEEQGQEESVFFEESGEEIFVTYEEPTDEIPAAYEEPGGEIPAAYEEPAEEEESAQWTETGNVDMDDSDLASGEPAEDSYEELSEALKSGVPEVPSADASAESADPSENLSDSLSGNPSESFPYVTEGEAGDAVPVLTLEQMSELRRKIHIWKSANNLTVVFDDPREFPAVCIISSGATGELLYEGTLAWKEADSLSILEISFDEFLSDEKKDIRNIPLLIRLTYGDQVFENVVSAEYGTAEAAISYDETSENRIAYLTWNPVEEAGGYQVFVKEEGDPARFRMFETQDLFYALDLQPGTEAVVLVAPVKADDGHTLRCVGEAGFVRIPGIPGEMPQDETAEPAEEASPEPAEDASEDQLLTETLPEEISTDETDEETIADIPADHPAVDQGDDTEAEEVFDDVSRIGISDEDEEEIDAEESLNKEVLSEELEAGADKPLSEEADTSEEKPDETEADMPDLAGDEDLTGAASHERYTVLLLDNSGSMSNKMTAMKQAAINFCRQMLQTDAINHIALIPYSSGASITCDFTDDLNTLTTHINSMSANGGTNIYSALTLAKTVLSEVPAKANKNIVLLSDGIPESGGMSETGRYTKADHDSSYKYGNVVYSTAKAMDSSWNIYTMGFFQGVTGKDLSFGQKLLEDIQNHGYYDVQDSDELEVVFDEISAGILDDLTIVGPLSAEDGDDITITATFRSEGSAPGKSNIKWKCEPEYLYFDNMKLEGPEVTGEENLWRITVDADVAFPDTAGKKTGSKKTSVSIKVGQYEVRKDFTVKAQTVFKAEKNGFPIINDRDGFGYPKDYVIPYRQYLLSMSGNIASSALGALTIPGKMYDSAHGKKWNGNCAGLSILAAAEFEGKIDLKHTYFSDNQGGVLTKYGYHSKTASDFSLHKDSAIVKLVERVQLAQQSAQMRACRVYKDDTQFQKLIAELESGNCKPYVTILSGNHAVVIDPSKPIIRMDNLVMVHIYDPSRPCSGTALRMPGNNGYVTKPYSDNARDVPFLYLYTDTETATISWPSGSNVFYPIDNVERKNVKFYDISKIDPSIFTGATYVGYTRGNMFTDLIDITWDNNNTIHIQPKSIISSDEKINYGIFTEECSQGASDDMYYFDADATLIEYDSPRADMLLVNDIYPAVYTLVNEGQAHMDVDLQNHIVSALAEEDNTKIIISSMIDGDAEDGYTLEMTLKKDQKVTVIQAASGEGLTFVKENVNSANPEADGPVDITVTYTNEYTSSSNVVTISDTTDIVFDRRSVTFEMMDDKCGDNAYWKISQDGILTIYGQGAIYDFRSDTANAQLIGYPWQDYRDRIEKIVIEEGITRIGNYAFYNTSVRNVLLPEGLREIGVYAFYKCNNLEEIHIPDTVTNIQAGAFSCCEALTEAVLPEGLTEISFYLFDLCKSLRNIIIPKGVTSIGGYAFAFCPLTDITIPYGVTNIGYSAFSSCSLSTLLLPPTVTEIGSSAFSYCGKLKSVVIPDSIKNITKYAFNSSGLQSVCIPSGVVSIGDGAFSSCPLKTIYLPSSLKNNAEDAFLACGSVTDVYYEGTEAQWKAIKTTSVYNTGLIQGTKHFECESVNLHDAVISGLSAKTYTGEPVIPVLTVKLSDTVLTEGTDYVTWYENNLHTGTATIYIQGIGNYTGTKRVTFRINPRAIAGATVSGVEDVAYTGREIIQKPVLTYGGTELQEGVDYELTFADNQDAGTASITITGIGDHQGAKTVYFEIASASIEDASILGVSSKLYTGSAIEMAPFVYYGGKRLKAGMDYEVAFDNNVTPGTATLTVYGTGNYVGQKKTTFRIGAVPVANLAISGISNKTYTGKAITQTPVLKNGTVTLKAGTDYTVSYKNNTNAGTATVTFTGKGNYTGTVSKSFKVNPLSIAGATVTGVSNKVYTGKAITQTPVVKLGTTTLKAGTDYAVTHSGNTNAGTATVTITGKGNYANTVKKTFTISKAAQTITVKAAASSVSVGKTTKVTITGAKGTKTWKSSNTGIATVSGAGVVTAKKVGTVKITATSAATTNYKAASKIVTIKVLPAATTSLKAENLSTGIRLTWKKVAGASGYLVYRGTTKIKTIGSGTTVTFVDKKAGTNGTKYTYKVVATASTGTSTLSKSVTAYRLAVPALKTVKNTAAKKIKATWGKNAKATGYELQYSTDSAFTSGKKTVTVTSASTISKEITGLTKGKTYYFRIRAYKKVGSVKYYSAWSTAKSVKITK